jgi:trk system potassium uptake protein TrkH
MLDDSLVKPVVSITVVYLSMYGLATLLGTFYGYDLSRSLFEGVSVAANTGLSCGVTDPAMPDVMKGAYILFMWAGRMEYMSVLALLGYGISIARGR